MIRAISISFAVLLLSAPVTIAADGGVTTSAKGCVDVQIGNDRSPYFACLNDAFQRQVQREHAPPVPEAPVDARSSPTQVGTFNETGARQQMGNAFGVTAVPQRPRPVFVSPLIPPNPR